MLEEASEVVGVAILDDGAQARARPPNGRAVPIIASRPNRKPRSSTWTPSV